MSDNYYALMSESIYHDDVELIKYYARKLASFCKEHRCATCPFYINDKCTFLKDSPDNWRGIEDKKVMQNDLSRINNHC